MEKIICPSCGKKTDGVKFCNECGAFLDRPSDGKAAQKEERKPKVIDATMKGALPVWNPNEKIEKIANTSVSDQGLTMLIDSCYKTVATVGGDGYREYVLYQRAENQYELHYYSKYEYMKEETHLAYRAEKAMVKEAYAAIDRLKLSDYENYQGIGPTGGIRILKYKEGDRIVRLTSENMPMDKDSLLYEIEAILLTSATEENRLA